MYSLSSPLTLKGLLKLNTTTTVLLVILFTLYVTSCEARHLRVNGKYSSKKSSLPSKDVTEVGATKEQIRALVMVDDMVLDLETQVGGKIDRSMGTDVLVKVKKEVESSGDSSRHSLRRRFQGIEVRSAARERSVLGVKSSRGQVGSKATTAYAAETLVAMDYPVAHPAPAIHNR